LKQGGQKTGGQENPKRDEATVKTHEESRVINTRGKHKKIQLDTQWAQMNWYGGGMCAQTGGRQ